MHHIIGAALIGAIAAGTTASRRVQLRPVLKKVVMGGILAKRKIEAVGGAAVEEAQKLIEEARADLKHQGREQNS